MNILQAKKALDVVIDKSRVHMYKPIQVAEILFNHRTQKTPVIDLSKLETYRTSSLRWRDAVSRKFVGSASTSSARFQGNLFEANATPPEVLATLGAENVAKSGIVEAYIYRQFEAKHLQLSKALIYCLTTDRAKFKLDVLLKSFRADPGLKRSIDKIYEIVVYSLFSVLAHELNVSVTISLDPSKRDLLKEFEDFAKKIIGLDTSKVSETVAARFFRAGVANAADRGLDMWANYGPAVQIKHISLDAESAEGIMGSVSADRVVIVCKTCREQKTIISIVKQLGWQSRIQSIVTEDELIDWYEKAFRGAFSATLGDQVLTALKSEIAAEFPSTAGNDFELFVQTRGYDKLQDDFWK